MNVIKNIIVTPCIMKISNSEDSALATKKAFDIFLKLTKKELNTLLGLAGVVPMKDKAMMIEQALIVWFHGDIPNMTEFCRLVEYYKLVL